MLSMEDQDFWIKKPQHGLDDLMSASSGSEKRTIESEGHEPLSYTSSAEGSPIKVQEEHQVAFHQQVEHYINGYVKTRYCEHKKNWREVQRTMVETTKRTLKIVTAVLSIWVPGLVKVISNLSSDAGDTIHNYSHIAFGKLRDRDQ
jgi:hypothetical protein